MKYALKQTSTPTQLLTLEEVKEHLRISTTTEDNYVLALILAATEVCEELTGRAFMSRDFEMWMDAFPADSAYSNRWRDGVTEEPIYHLANCRRWIELPKGHASAVASIKTYDDDDTESTFSTSFYRTDFVSEPARITLKRDALWPVALRPTSAIKISFTAGYGTAADVPNAIKHAVKYLVAHAFENREPVIVGSISKAIEISLMAFLAPYRIVKL